jgi:hypothetical protein
VRIAIHVLTQVAQAEKLFRTSGACYGHRATTEEDEMAKSRSKRTPAKPKQTPSFRKRAPVATAEAVFPEPASEVQDAPSSAVRRVPTEQAIRALAYDLFLGRGDAPGRQIDDWLEAERQLRAG